ncbi:MAG TPA: sulfite exporter TauE/SafE family protein [Nevskiaceae bacterium]|nr:sulfite exporter TauE/SafE family protein [Nevskiaceae bacterium]
MQQLLIYLATGALAGVLAGLFGVGGGVIMVPALALVLPTQGVPAAVVMQVALGTSLAVIAITSISSTLAHQRRGGVRWDILLRFAPGLAIGAIAGAYVADHLNAGELKRTFGIGAVLISAQMFSGWQPRGLDEAAAPRTPELLGVGGLIGLLSSLIGIGGGSLTVPYFSARGLAMREAVGTAAASGMPIAWAGAIGFMLAGAGHGTAALPDFSVGYVNLAAFFGLAVASTATAPVGARLAHTLPPQQVKRAFAILLLSTGLKMLLA